MTDDGFLSIEDLIHSNKQKEPKEKKEHVHGVADEYVVNAGSQQKPSVAEKLDEKMENVRLETLEDETRSKAAKLSMPYINLVGFPIGPETISLIPEEEAKENKILLFFRYEDLIRVATTDPDHEGIHDVIANLQTRHENANIELFLTSEHSFTTAFKLYKNVTKVKVVTYGVKITSEDLKRFQKELTSYEIFEKKLQEVNMTEAFAMMISMAINADSSDIHLEAGEKEMIIRFRIDGVLTEVAHLPLNMQHRIVSRIKTISELKINISSVPQDGRISIDFGKDNKLDIRVSTLPSAYGESVVFRLLQSSSIGLSFEDLGMRPAVFGRLKKEIEKPNGMIITTGPTGSGKTTTLCAILNKLNSPESKIITLENPIEYKLKGIVQSQIDHSKDYTFQKGLRAILRQDPDIVMVGEIRDFETAETAIEAALTGHLMLSTIHTNDASGVIPRFLGMGVKGIFLAPALNAVIGQRLVRRICEHCKKEYTPSKEQVDKMREWVARIPKNSGEEHPDLDSVTFYKGEGCAKCSDTGYRKRVGIYEVFTIVPEIEQQILSGKVSEFQMKEILHGEGMVTMGQDGLLKVIEGITTLDEVFRVTKE